MFVSGGWHSLKFEHITWVRLSGICQLFVLEESQYILCNPANNLGRVIQLNLGPDSTIATPSHN